MYDDNKIRSIIHKLQEDLLKWIELYKPDLIRCELQANNANIESKDIKQAIADGLKNDLHLSRRIIAYFSNPYQKHLAERLAAEIEKADWIGNFDARQKNVTIFYLSTILEINSVLDDCLAAVSHSQIEGINHLSGNVRNKADLKKIITKPKRSDSPKKSRKKGSAELLKEVRERRAVQVIAGEPGITCSELAKELGCHKSTITRLKAWRQKSVLVSEPKKGIMSRQKDDSYIIDSNED